MDLLVLECFCRSISQERSAESVLDLFICFGGNCVSFISGLTSVQTKFPALYVTLYCKFIHRLYDRGYSNFLWNLVFISSSEVENMYIS